jgi:hypothetical protein
VTDSNLTPQQLDVVRRQVQGLLGRTQSFQELEAPAREKLANDMVQVLSFLADPTAGEGGEAPAGANPELLQLVEAQAGKTGSVSNQPSDKTAGDLLNPAAAKQAGQSFQELTSAVDFPEFVSGLVEGVFTSIVDSSIRQMQEYGKLLEAVVMSVNQFKNDHIAPRDARQDVLDRFPGFFEMEDTEDGEGRLAAKSDLDDEEAPDLSGAYGVDSDLDLSEPENEQKLVESARLKLAQQRQQQLATMVLLGINRIIVTDGYINAKVFIDVRSRDRVERENVARQYQRDTERSYERKRSFWGTSRSGKVNTSVTSAYAQSKDKSESEIKTRANLTGEVRINFRSETFPLERLGSPEELGAVNAKGGPRR